MRTLVLFLAFGCGENTSSPPADTPDLSDSSDRSDASDRADSLPPDTLVPDSASDAPRDAGSDALPDAPPDAPADAPLPDQSDAAPDVSSDTPSNDGVDPDAEADVSTCLEPCDDGNPCTTADACVSGVCSGTPLTCFTPPSSECSSPATRRTYESGTCVAGVCEYSFADSPCPAPEDGTGVCSDGTCSGFTCDPGYVACGEECHYISCDCDPDLGCWEPMVSEGAPDPRWYHTAVWTGIEMIVWGGFNAECGTEMATGGRYDPVADTWTPTSTDGAPSARMNHTAVWTGTEMIVWGGRTCSPFALFADGARYDPTTGGWIELPSDDAPAARSWHTAIWTGTEMIVWGGLAAVPFSSGGRYTYGDLLWVPLSTDLAPSARSDHIAVWTGTEMLVWGGFVGSDPPVYLGDGGVYTFSTDEWSLLSDSVLVGRLQHTAVWTGMEMIVWGGSSNGVRLTDGASFMPGGDPVWMLLSSDGAPSARGSHTAVWTGTEMIVWGGHTSTELFGDGARYNPDTGAWSAVSMAGAPDPRSYHTAVGADDCKADVGSQPCMIVWGGSCIGTACLAGAKYFPPRTP